MEQGFAGPRYTVGIEEELMILDSDSFDLISAVESIVDEDPASGQIKPELLESVLEIATSPCPDIATVGAELASLRARTGAGSRSARPGRTPSPAGRISVL